MSSPEVASARRPRSSRWYPHVGRCSVALPSSQEKSHPATDTESASATSSSNVRGIWVSTSESGVVAVHQGGRGASQDAARRGDLGQYIGGNELRHGDLSLVERLLFAHESLLGEVCRAVPVF